MKAQPSSKTAEKAVLGSCIINPVLIDRVEGWIQEPNAFYYKDHEIVWTIILGMWKRRETIDTVTIVARIKEIHKTMITPAYYVTGMIDSVPSTANAEAYAKIVWEKYIQREVIKGARQLETMSYDDFGKVEEVLMKHKSRIIELEMMQPSQSKDIDSILMEAEDSIKTRGNMIPFGIEALDEPAGGMTRGEISILGGRPGHGKTTMVVSIVKSIINQGYKLVLFNREMSNIEFMKKLITLESNYLYYGNVRSGDLSNKEAEELPSILKRIKDKYTDNLFMYDTIRDVNQAMREIRKHNPDVVVDDYIQLIDVNKKVDGRRFEIENILTEYKWLAKEKYMSCLLVSQLSRDIEKRIDPRPKLSDYAESGVIEQVCENAFFVFYGYHFDPENDDYGEYKSEIISAKARYGKPGRFDIGFNGGRCKFYATEQAALIDRVGEQKF